MKRFFLIACLLCGFSEAKILRLPYEGTRPLGMGNAFIALADDSNVLWYNPAALTKVQGPRFHVLDLTVGADGMNSFNRMTDAALKGKYDNLLRSDTQYVKAGVRPVFLMPYFGFGIYDQVTSYTDLNNLSSLDATVDLFTANDIVATAGFGIPATKYFSVGFAVKAIQRSAVDGTLTGQNLIDQAGTTQGDFLAAVHNSLDNLQSIGWAVGLNVGVLGEIPLATKSPRVRLAATIEDVGQTTFQSFGSSTNKPPPLKPSYNFGSAFTYTLAKDLVWNFTADLRNTFDSINFAKIFHFGTEIRHKRFGIRAGIYQGYLSYGASLEFPSHTRLHFASVETELGDGFRQRGFRSYLLQLQIGFNPF